MIKLHKVTYKLPSSVTVNPGDSASLGKVSDICGAGARFVSAYIGAGAEPVIAECVVMNGVWDWNEMIRIRNFHASSAATLAANTSIYIVYAV